jgi:hypothetical protein
MHVSRPVLSLVLGFITYVLLDFSYGAGANTEGTATPTQQYYSSIAQPAGVCIAVGGIVLSIWLDFLTLPKRDRPPLGFGRASVRSRRCSLRCSSLLILFDALHFITF